jgi:N-methylhydantoinase B
MNNPFKTQLLHKSMQSILERLRERTSHLGNLNFNISCAILDQKGELLEVLTQNSLHITVFEPVVRSVKTYFAPKIGESFITNDPYSGGTRLCDLILVQGAFGTQTANELRFFVAVQITIPTIINKEWKNLFSSVEDEGYRIPPSPLDQNGLINPAILDYIAQSGFDRNELAEILGNVKIALKKATHELSQLEKTTGRDEFQKICEALKLYSETQMRMALHEIPDGEYEAQDFLDNDGQSLTPIKINCELRVHGEKVVLNFSGTSRQTTGPFNCSYALTLAACFSTLRSLVKKDIPINSGALRVFSIEAQEGTIINAAYPSALLGGYYETTHRISDTVKACLSKALPRFIPSLSGGSSSPILMKFFDSGSARLHFETIGCGSGASATQNGSDVIRPEFDNTKASSIESLESDFEVQVIQHTLRDSAHGDGKKQGGRALTRGYKFLGPVELMLLGDRQKSKIQGFFGGKSGIQSETLILKNGEKVNSDSTCKMFIKLNAGDTLFFSSPSGAGWGKADKEKDVE